MTASSRRSSHSSIEGGDTKRRRGDNLQNGAYNEEYFSEDENSHTESRLEGNGAGSLWQKTIQKVIKAVVSIQFTNITNFDTESVVVSEATGFVVDAQRGLILTNRHVVGPGPFCGYAVFDNHEEAVVTPIYRDPVHDFGFLQFDVKTMKYMDLTQLELKPDLAKVGTEIRVVGNDAGEKLSILAGFISRLDRNAPDYGSLTYNDFNTEYIQAAASASGGSSGSPVINEDGHAVALQAGGSTEASTDFFLPVFRPLRALRCIQKSMPITRGDIQVIWQLEPYDECRRLGLTPAAEERARSAFPSKIGMLVAEMVLPQGPADGLIREGDTLISVNDELIATFVRLDEILDSRVGDVLKFVVQRGGEELELKINVGDLHAITPDRYVEVAGAVFNEMSYQVARCYCIPVKGVFVADAVGSFEISAYDKTGWLLESVDDKPTPNLDAFIEVMKQIPDRHTVPITYRHVSDLHSELVRNLYIDRHWQSGFRLATRNDKTGLWDFTDIQKKPLPPVKRKPMSARFFKIPFEESKAACASLVNSFVQLRVFTPIPLDSHPYKQQVGYGVVIDAEKGYVLVARRFLPHDLCDILVIVAESVDIPGEVVFLHPLLNYGIIKYDPSLVQADVRTPKFGTKPLKRGEKSLFVGYNYNMRLVNEDVKVSAVSSLNVPPAVLSPRYRGTTLQCILLDSKLSQECNTGVLADEDGTVRAFWLTYLGESNSDQSADKMYRMGLDVTDVLDVIALIQKNQVPKNLRIVDAEFISTTIFQARTRGVSQEWISKYEEESEDEIFFLSVDRVAASPLNRQPVPLRPGDIVLTINGKLVREMRDFNVMYHADRLQFKVIRQKKELDVEIPTTDTSTLSTSNVVFWGGATIQAPHYGVRQQMEKIVSEVYITHRGRGGPGHQYALVPNSFVTHINDQETKDVEAFINIVKDIPDNTYVKIRLVSFDNIPMAISLKTNYHYFPTSQLKKDDAGQWVEIAHP